MSYCYVAVRPAHWLVLLATTAFPVFQPLTAITTALAKRVSVCMRETERGELCVCCVTIPVQMHLPLSKGVPNSKINTPNSAPRLYGVCGRASSLVSYCSFLL